LTVALMMTVSGLCSAQQLHYKSRAIGNTDFKGPGTHMSNHIVDMNVSGDGMCTTFSVWDEGGNARAAYKDGAYFGRARFKANSKSVKDLAGRTWSIENYYGRFLSMPTNGGGKELGPQAGTTMPVPIGSSAPFLRCSDGREIRLVADPGAIGINLKTGQLLVADNGPDQDIKTFDVANGTPKLVATFGKKGGVYGASKPGDTTDMLRFRGITGVGGDGSGNLYVAMDGYPGAEGGGCGAELRAFRPNGSLLWRMQGLLFVASGTVDPASQDGSDIYGAFTHFKMDYRKPTGQDWNAVAISIDPFKYPDDPRLVHSMDDGFAVRNVNHRKYLFTTDMYDNMTYVFRFDGNIAAPCAGFCTAYGWNGDEVQYSIWNYRMGRPNAPRWLWVDKNGDGAASPNEYETFNVGRFCNAIDVDDEGNFYVGGDDGVYEFPTNGFDKRGNPRYSASTMKLIARVGHEVHSMKYVEEKDIFVCGDGYAIKNVDVFADWSKPTRKKLFSVPIPQHLPGHDGGPRQLTADRDFFYVTYQTKGGPHTGKEGEIDVYRLNDGSFVGYITPGPEVGGISGWIDMNTPTKVFRRSDGVRIITTEEDWTGKILVYEWNPANDLHSSR